MNSVFSLISNTPAKFGIFVDVFPRFNNPKEQLQDKNYKFVYGLKQNWKNNKSTKL